MWSGHGTCCKDFFVLIFNCWARWEANKHSETDKVKTRWKKYWECAYIQLGLVANQHFTHAYLFAVERIHFVDVKNRKAAKIKNRNLKACIKLLNIRNEKLINQKASNQNAARDGLFLVCVDIKNRKAAKIKNTNPKVWITKVNYRNMKNDVFDNMALPIGQSYKNTHLFACRFPGLAARRWSWIPLPLWQIWQIISRAIKGEEISTSFLKWPTNVALQAQDMHVSQ